MTEEITGLEREALVGTWSMLAEWYCVPVDWTPEEEEGFLINLRLKLGDDFAACPLEYLRQRCYGGFECRDYPHRRHVVFVTGEFSYLNAAEGIYWERTPERRRESWCHLRAANLDQSWGGGPFCEDACSDADALVWAANKANE